MPTSSLRDFHISGENKYYCLSGLQPLYIFKHSSRSDIYVARVIERKTQRMFEQKFFKLFQVLQTKFNT